MSALSISGFDWDEGNREKCGKHGVSPREIEDVFRGEVLVAPDPKHSGAEARLIAVGRTRAGRAVFVAFTLRVKAGVALIRPVSARYMHRKEIEAYEKKSS
jgi:uncharacterized DUF497 family protein